MLSATASPEVPGSMVNTLAPTPLIWKLFDDDFLQLRIVRRTGHRSKPTGDSQGKTATLAGHGTSPYYNFDKV